VSHFDGVIKSIAEKKRCIAGLLNKRKDMMTFVKIYQVGIGLLAFSSNKTK